MSNTATAVTPQTTKQILIKVNFDKNGVYLGDVTESDVVVDIDTSRQINTKTTADKITQLISNLVNLQEFNEGYNLPTATGNVNPNTDYSTETDFTHIFNRVRGSDPTLYDAIAVLEAIKKKNEGVFKEDDYKNLYETLYNALIEFQKNNPDPDSIKWYSEKVPWHTIQVSEKNPTMQESNDNYEIKPSSISGGGKLGIKIPNFGIKSSVKQTYKQTLERSKSAKRKEREKSETISEKDKKTLLSLWDVVRYHNPFFKQLGVLKGDVNVMIEGVKETLKVLLDKDNKAIPKDFRTVLSGILTAIKEQRDFYFLDSLVFSYCKDIVKSKGYNPFFHLSQNLPHIIFSNSSRTKKYKDGTLPVWDSLFSIKGSWGNIEGKDTDKLYRTNVMEKFIKEITKQQTITVISNRTIGTPKNYAKQNGGNNHTRKITHIGTPTSPNHLPPSSTSLAL